MPFAEKESPLTLKQKEIDSTLRKQNFDEMQNLLHKAYIKGSVNMEFFKMAYDYLKDNLNATKEQKQLALNFIVEHLPSEAKAELLKNFKFEHQNHEKNLYINNYLTFNINIVYQEPSINFGEGAISVSAMKKFGIGDYDKNSKIFKLSKKEIELFFELQHEYTEKGLNGNLSQEFDYYVDTLHATAGVLKIMDEGYSKEKAKQIINDLRDIFGIHKFGRYDATILIEQHKNTTIIKDNGELSYKLKLNSTKEQTVFIGAQYEYNGSAYRTMGNDFTSPITKQIKGLQKGDKTQVWIYEGGFNYDVLWILNDFNSKISSIKNKNKKYDIVISGHGNKNGIRMCAEGEGKRFDSAFVHNHGNTFEEIKENVNNIIILGCSSLTRKVKDEKKDINYLAEELYKKTHVPIYVASTKTYGVIFRENNPKIIFLYGNIIGGVQIYKDKKRFRYIGNIHDKKQWKHVHVDDITP